MVRPPEMGTNLMVSFCLLAIQTKGPLNGLASFLLSPARSEVDTNTLAPTGIVACVRTYQTALCCKHAFVSHGQPLELESERRSSI